ncbi:hypothetical protein PROFUN_14350 [Planoprotostelium fungivorum]|uniref:Sfi1 spindle body domain-containing protein n=1 Tax=Planoprotostelium fungivorum TaxID=1890364 RepID=A0A2P6MZY9_9EUKA|nr:hypothetical protein PROFUN_14350 [Planoprotostelium fungivorum]
MSTREGSFTGLESDEERGRVRHLLDELLEDGDESIEEDDREPSRRQQNLKRHNILDLSSDSSFIEPHRTDKTQERDSTESEDIALYFWAHRLLIRVFDAWRLFSRTCASRRDDWNAARAHDYLRVSSRFFHEWQRRMRLRRILAARESLGAWKLYVQLKREKRKKEREAHRWYETRKLSITFSAWRMQTLEWKSKETRKIIADQYQHHTLIIRMFQRRNKKTREAEAKRMYVSRLQKKAIHQLVELGIHFRDQRQKAAEDTFLKKVQLEFRLAQKYAQKWKEFIYRRRLLSQTPVYHFESRYTNRHSPEVLNENSWRMPPVMPPDARIVTGFPSTQRELRAKTRGEDELNIAPPSLTRKPPRVPNFYTSATLSQRQMEADDRPKDRDYDEPSDVLRNSNKRIHPTNEHPRKVSPPAPAQHPPLPVDIDSIEKKFEEIQDLKDEIDLLKRRHIELTRRLKEYREVQDEDAILRTEREKERIEKKAKEKTKQFREQLPLIAQMQDWDHLQSSSPKDGKNQPLCQDKVPNFHEDQGVRFSCEPLIKEGDFYLVPRTPRVEANQPHSNRSPTLA